MANDPEIEAMSKVAEALSSLDDDEARGRVLRWAAERHGVVLAKGAPTVRRRRDVGNEDDDGDDGDEDEFAEVGDLVSAAQPTSDAERALVVAFWLQEHKGEKQLGGQAVNKELKNLGHGVTRINDVFTELINTRPQQVIQTRKKGTAQQARKQYKVTKAGIERVEEMLAESGEE